jgi:hypothetical protein
MPASFCHHRSGDNAVVLPIATASTTWQIHAMLRTTLLALVLAVTGCQKEPTPVYPGEAPPLPPASGTPVGYLIDNEGPLELSVEQLTQLKQIDGSLAARNDSLNTQLREIERPEEQPPPGKDEPPRPPPNMAPGATPIHTTADAGKLHAAIADNNREALEKAFALLQPAQQVTARRLLDARGIKSPKPIAAPPPLVAPPDVSPPVE